MSGDDDVCDLDQFGEGFLGRLGVETVLEDSARIKVVLGQNGVAGNGNGAGRIFEHSFDTEAAKEALTELVEIADVIIPGHDNIFMPMR